ncbi:hypothetical protein C2E23DRAFT_863834 [Lenzites betulinus]|nr:hypothetical protein C2E23DRAFT_863834 [Lenzites betulinus]
MRFSLSVFIATLAASAFAADPLVISTPTDARQCETGIVEWTGGVAPFDLTRRFDGTHETINDIQDQFYDMNYNLPSGTVITLEIEDAVGDKAASGAYTVQPSIDTINSANRVLVSSRL